MALEVGCGAGIYTRYLSNNSSCLIAFDIQKKQVLEAVIRESKQKNIFFLQADACALPLADRRFDLVVCTQVLEHIEDDKRALQEMSRVLKEKGRLVLSVPVPPSPIKFSAVRYDTHCKEGYNYEELASMLKKEKFIILKYEYGFFVLARLAFKIIEFSDRHFGIRPPGIFIAMLSWADRLLALIVKIKPYSLNIECQKT